MTLIAAQEEAIAEILATPQQGKRAANYGMTLLNRRPRSIRRIRRTFEERAFAMGYNTKQINRQWNDIKDMAQLEDRAK